MHTSRNITSQDTYSVLAEVWENGPDGIDSAWVSYRDWPRVALRQTPQGSWTARLTASYFSDPKLGSVVGQPFTFTVLTEADSLYTETPVFLFRVIEGTPVLESPMQGDTTTAFPQLAWLRFEASFPFTQLVTVIRLEEEFESIRWISEILSSTQVTLTVPDSLEDGAYYWTLSVQDTFENGSRSKEGMFTVLAGGGT